MTPQGVTKQQVEMQLNEFKRQLWIKEKLLEVQERRVNICTIAVERADALTIQLGLGEISDPRRSNEGLWDLYSRREMYQLDADQSQLMADSLGHEILELTKAVGELEGIIKRMESGVILPNMARPLNPQRN